MRVIYFSRDYTTHDWRHLDKLANTDHDVWFLRLEKGSVVLEERAVPKKIEVIDWTGGQRPIRGLVDQIKLLPNLKSVFKEVQPDLVHAGPIQSCGFLSALTGFRPLLLMSWGSDVLTGAERGPLWHWITNFTLRRADMIVGDSDAVCEKIHRLVNYPYERMAKYPWGIDLGSFKPGAVRPALREQLGWQDKRVLISTRSWEPIYGVDVLLRAFAKVLRQLRDARLLLMGDGTLAPRILSYIRSNNLTEFIHVSGQIAEGDLVDYFNSADLYISASYSDGTSISLLEAMACALPVVVSDIPGNREWVSPEANGWLFRAGDASSLAASLLRAMNETERWAEMGTRNRAIAQERADWNKNFQVLLDVYDRLSKTA